MASPTVFPCSWYSETKKRILSDFRRGPGIVLKQPDSMGSPIATGLIAMLIVQNVEQEERQMTAGDGDARSKERIGYA